MKKVLGYLKLILCGMVFGVANVIPGVSGGTMLVVFGIYDQLTERLSNIFAATPGLLIIPAPTIESFAIFLSECSS